MAHLELVARALVEPYRQGMAKDTHVIADKALTVTTVKSMSTSARPIPV